MQRKGLRIVLGFLVVLLVLVLGAIGFSHYTSSQRAAEPFAIANLDSDSEVQVQQDPWLVFSPVKTNPTTGLILYPGGLVDPRAYAPNAHAIAAAGYLVVIPSMPLNLAVLNPNAAQKVIGAFPQITHWVVGGHSLGGSMAATFIDQNPGLIEGLVLWASYPASSTDLSTTELLVTSIYGTEDGLAKPEDVLSGKPLLPPDTIWVPIQGGNHYQFGWYGTQKGDNAPAISHEAQLDQIVEATVALLEKIDS